ncbi:extracellular chitinase [Drepanopeziza brunnea f. sp. 'multigermtubi' MB_m1]|uniref:chitinase n=1 Tax=Marssonina brunnea f. sp. multigermtubi (strain MB_m1) TaxID=1072389 RepID=K1WVJ7_MARBU|nr:extracellular chitinase [Drepanopeziza brunnea f. sp. 'multigermtubi' MB_m1]EKD16502.1 extracellular chitinase [Drepanopeziza brunnea f. sp. 'multigermtubi' MB_m1]
MKFSLATGLLGLSSLHMASAKYVFYVSQYYLTTFPNATVAAGVDTVIMTFANSSYFVSPPQNYTPFEPVETMRARFDPGVKILVAIGGWGDTEGFRKGAATEESRKDYAKNLVDMVNTLGFDGIDIDWEYPGGNGYDYKQVPNSDLTSEIETYPLLLKEIKCALAGKELSIAVPGLERDMIAYTPESSPAIWEAVDYVNLMTYDLMNRRDNVTKHHADVVGSLAAVDYYIGTLGLPPAKAVLGVPFYAKWASVDKEAGCDGGLGCRTVLLEDAAGQDTGESGTVTFETSSYAPPADGTNLPESPDGSCGATAGYRCTSGNCCSQFGFCGDSADFCGSNCLKTFGLCDTDQPTVAELFQTAMANGVLDEEAGGMYYYDETNSVFWTWDDAAMIARKFEQIIKARGLAGVMAWSLTQDSYDWSRILALQAGMKSLTATA